MSGALECALTHAGMHCKANLLRSRPQLQRGLDYAERVASYALDSKGAVPEIEFELELGAFVDVLSLLGRVLTDRKISPANSDPSTPPIPPSAASGPSDAAGCVRDRGGGGSMETEWVSAGNGVEGGRLGVKRRSSCLDESTSQQPSISMVSHRNNTHQATLETQSSDDSCAFKFGKKVCNVVVGRGRVVGQDIDPSGGMAVLLDPVSLCPLIIVGCSDEKAFRLYQGVYTCTYIYMPV